MGGRLILDSDEGQGAKLSIIMPIEEV